MAIGSPHPRNTATVTDTAQGSCYRAAAVGRCTYLLSVCCSIYLQQQLLQPGVLECGSELFIVSCNQIWHNVIG